MAFVERPPEPCESYLPGEEAAPKPWEVKHVEFDQDEAREAYVGAKYDKFAELFDSFEDSDEFKFSFIWPPLFFGWVWFIHRKMYQEGLLFFVSTTFVRLVVPSFPGGVPLTWLLVNLALALCGGWLYYRKTENQIEKALALYGEDPVQIIGWLRWNGGTTGWAVFAGLLELWLFFMRVMQVGLRG